MNKVNLSNILNKAASKVSNLAGGRDLVDYAGTKIAQRNNPGLSIPQTTSGKDALKSGAKVFGTVATLAGAGLSRALAKKAGTSFKIPGQKKSIKISRGGKGREIPQRKTWDEGGW